MRKRVFGKKLSRSYTARMALMRSLVFSLVQNNKIKTTLSKAKFVDGFFKKLVNDATKEGLTGHRIVLSKLGNNKEVSSGIMQLVDNWDKKAQVTKITRIENRKGDNAKMAVLEILLNKKKVEESVKEKPVEKEQSRVAKAKRGKKNHEDVSTKK